MIAHAIDGVDEGGARSVGSFWHPRTSSRIRLCLHYLDNWQCMYFHHKKIKCWNFSLPNAWIASVEQELPLLARWPLKEVSYRECDREEQEQGRCRGDRTHFFPKVDQRLCLSQTFLQLHRIGKVRCKGDRIVLIVLFPKVGQSHPFPSGHHHIVFQRTLWFLIVV